MDEKNTLKPTLGGLSRFVSLTKTSFRQQLTFTFSVGILLLAIVSSIAISSFTSQALRNRLLIEGQKINTNLASQSVLALLYNSPENAKELINATLAYPDVLGLVILDVNKQVLVAAGESIDFSHQLIVQYSKDSSVPFETEKAWYFVAPVYSHAVEEVESSPFRNSEGKSEIIGHTVLVFGKQTLNTMVSNILRSNLIVSIVLSFLLLIILLIITRRMTNPLKNLADIMRRAEQGEYDVRAEVKGPRDIIDMEKAFNIMMQALQSRDIELTMARDAALESARAKGEFTARVTHELRTPMNGVLGMLELLSGSVSDEKQIQYIDVARGSAESLLLLIDDILDFSRNDAKKAKIELEDFNLRDSTEKIIKLLSIQADKKDIHLELEVADSVPKLLYGAKGRIRQILINLIGNGIKFTEEGSVRVKLSVVSAPIVENDESRVTLLFEVIDTGIGIPEQSQKKIFEVFSQADGTSTRKYGGSGLGLAICQQLVVESLGGDIGVESQFGKGSRFWFTVSLKISEPNALIEPHDDMEYNFGASLPTIVPNNGSSSSGKKQILVVEDNRTNQQVVQGMLERIGCHVTMASDGRAALDTVFRKKFDLVLMDIQMPGMDGYEVTNQIRKLEGGEQRLPIIAMTANVHQSDIDHCLLVGMDDFLAKPLKMNLLRDKVFRWIGGEENTKNKQQSSSKLSNNADGSTLHESPIDEAVLYELRHNLGDGFPGMLKTYLEDLPMYIHNLKKAVHGKNAKLLDITAHTLKGSSRNIGAMRLGNFCRALEDMAKLEITDEANSILKALIEESAALVKVLGSEVRSEDFIKKGGDDKNIRILVVDDDRSMRLAMRQVLERDGYTIEEAVTGGQVIDSCHSQIPDLILMDAMMPGVDGFSACKQLRQIPGCEHIPVIMVTALEDTSSIERAFLVGATDYIPKPVNFAVLRQRISRLMNASKAEKHVRHLAYHDALTGLPNRATFINKLKELIDRPRADKKLLAVFFIDLDRFKLVNDTLGHDMGDKLLKVAAERLLLSIRKSDVVARLGGDEFTIILDGVSSMSSVAKIANKICKHMAEPFIFNEHKIYVSASIGISMFPTDASDFHELIKYADTAMFKAKENRGGYQFYESEMEVFVKKRVELENELRSAIDNNEFVLYYQPQMDMSTEQIVGMEALIRWNHPQNKLILPTEFIPMAEETGLIGELGKWVLREGCTQLRTWIDKGYPPIKLSVNLSSRQFEDQNLADEIASIMYEANIPSSLLELEITESTIMKNPEQAMQILVKLHLLGIALAIDDFGTGHSSLNYLKRLRVDTLKIDRSFVADILSSPQDAAIVKGIIALAKNLHLKIVAEGVETYEQKIFLKENGCDMIQGYYLYKPLPAATFEEVIFYKKQAANF